MRELHRKLPWSARRRGNPAVCHSGDCDLGADPLRQPADLGAAGPGSGFHHLQFHHPAARGRAPHRFPPPASGCGTRAEPSLRDSKRHLGQSVHALAPGPSCRARLRRRRSQAAPSLAEDQRAVVQALVLHTGALPDLFSRGTAGIRDISVGSAATNRDANAGCRRSRISPPWRRSGRFSGSPPRCAPASSPSSSFFRSPSRSTVSDSTTTSIRSIRPSGAR